MHESTLSIDELLDQASWLRRLARGLTRDASEADEVVQDTWLAALRNPPDRRGPPRPWLRSVLRNALRMRRRASSRRALREETCHEQSDQQPAQAAPSPEEWAHRLQLQRQLVQLVLELGEPQRSTLLLHYYQDLPAAEIARLQGVPASTVRWRLQSAIATLKGQLDDAYGERPLWLRAFAPLAAGIEGAGSGHEPGGTDSADTGAGEAVSSPTSHQPQGSSGSPYLFAALGAAAIGVFVAAAAVSAPEASGESSAASRESSQPEEKPHGHERAGDVPNLGLRSEAELGRDVERPYWMGELFLEGQVVDLEGDPVPGAEVSLIGAGPLLTTRSEGDGSFSFDGLEEKDYTLSATAPGLAGGPVSHSLTDTSPPAVLWLGAASTLELTVVASESGEPLADARATVGSTYRYADEGGRITFEGLQGGAHSIKIYCEGRAPVTHTWVAPTGPAVALSSEVELDRGFAVSGRVLFPGGASNSVPVTTLWVRDVTTGERTRVRNAVDLTTGEFEIVVPVGAIQIEAMTGYPAPQEGTTEVLDVAGAVRGVEIPLQPSPAATIEGVVLGEDGAPVPFASVFASRERVIDEVRAWTDDDGRFRLFVDAGENSVWAAKGADGSAQSSALRSDRQKVQAGTAGTQEVTLRLRPTELGTVAGTVVDRAGHPVPEAQVAFAAFSPLRASPKIRSIPTDAEGRFALQLPVGEVELWASRVGLDPQALSLLPGKKVDVDSGEVTLELLSTCGLRGRIDRGGPVPDQLSIRLGRRGPTHIVPIEGGGFELDGLPCGEQELFFPGAEYGHRGPHKASLRPGYAHDLGTLAMAGVEIRGAVVDELGDPVEGARIEFRPAEASGSEDSFHGSLNRRSSLFASGKKSTASDEAGRFRLAGISGGYVVADHPSAGRSVAAPVPRTGAAPEFRLVVRRTGVLRGTLHGTIGVRARPIVTATCPADDGELSVGVGLDGYYQFNRLRPCRYRVSAHSPAGEELASDWIEVQSGDTSTLDLESSGRN